VQIHHLVKIAVVVATVLLLQSCGAINWNQEPPYSLVNTWGEKGSNPGQFNDPTGIAVTSNEVFVSDARNSRIQVFDKMGNFKRAFGQQQLGRPMNLAIANDTLYVPDYFKDAVHVFALDGQYQGAIETSPALDSPGGVAVFPDGDLLVADTYGQRLVRVSPEGSQRRTWSGKGIWSGEFNYSTSVAVDNNGGFYVADGYNDRVQQFGTDGEYMRKWGGPFGLNIFGPFKGWFATVTSIAIGPEGNLFVADFYNNRIQKFTAEGDYLTSFGVESDGPGQTEIAVAVDSDGTVWSVNFDANRVEQWRP
tara:strand:+ start:285 stop:1205 length:921 start_codon:yes stop_codon:yes gene_type:complete